MLKMRDVTKKHGGAAGPPLPSRGHPGDRVPAGDGDRRPSGCGQSTLLLMAGTLLQPSDGKVFVNDVEPDQLSAGQRSEFRISMSVSCSSSPT